MARTKAAEKPVRKTRTATAKSSLDVKEKPVRRTRKVAEEPVKKTRGRAAKAEAEKPVRRTRKAAAEEAAPVKKTRATRATKEVEEAPAKTRRTKKTAVAEAIEKVFNPYANLDATLDGIEKQVGLSDSSMDRDEKRQSTGSLALDILLGGGVTAGWYTNFGQEQSCKTTTAVMMMVAALNSNVPILYYFDYEGSAEPNYLENIMRRMGVNADVRSVFGVRDKKTGDWVVPPRVRYRDEGIAEKFFNAVSKLLRSLPDKRKIGDSWYYIYDSKTAEGKIHKENAKIVGDMYDKNYFRKTGKYRIPAPDGTLQAMILVDSYPAMLPEKDDVDDPNGAVGKQARMFANELKRVKGRLKGKRVAVLGINQLRLRPMTTMGNPEYETCGEALKLYSDVRMKFTSRALSGVSKFLGETIKGDGQIEIERSVNYKGDDNYRYIHVRAHKNKLSRPYLEAYLRLWITDAKGNAQGFDPVFDTYQYLKFTGQVSGNRKKMTLKFAGNEAKKTLGWLDFKSLIIGDNKTIKATCEAIGMKPIKLREKCFAQLAAGKGIDLYNDYTLSGGADDEAETEDNEGEGEEE